MAKSALEKQLEKQRKERERIARQEATRTQATTIINGQPIIEGVRILDDTAEEFLRILLQQRSEGNNHVGYEYETIPSYMQPSLELEKLVQYGMISNVNLWLGGGLQLQPKALTYFHDKEEAIMKSKENKQYGVINFGNYIVGNVTGSILNVDNSVHDIEPSLCRGPIQSLRLSKPASRGIWRLFPNSWSRLYPCFGVPTHNVRCRPASSQNMLWLMGTLRI